MITQSTKLSSAKHLKLMIKQEKEDYLYEYVDTFAEALAKLGEH